MLNIEKRDGIDIIKIVCKLQYKPSGINGYLKL